MKLRVATDVVRGASLEVVIKLRAHRALRRGSRFIVMIGLVWCVGRAEVNCLLLLEDED